LRRGQKVEQVAEDAVVPGDLADELFAPQVRHLLKQRVVALEAKLV